MTANICMGGVSHVIQLPDGVGMGAVTGQINGAAYGRPIGDPVDLGDGKMSFESFHYFLDRDGSIILTKDKGIAKLDERSGLTLVEVEYTLEKATGRFEGYTGSWVGCGTMDSRSDTPKGAFRFEGNLSK